MTEEREGALSTSQTSSSAWLLLAIPGYSESIFGLEDQFAAIAPWSVTRLGIAVLLACMCVSCDGEDYDEFFALPEPQRDSLYSTLSPEKQVDIFIVGRRKRHPPAPMIGTLARNGKSVIPTIAHRLENEESDIARADLLSVLQVMECDYYDVRGERRVMEAAIHAVADIREEYWRKQAAESLRIIVGGC